MNSQGAPVVMSRNCEIVLVDDKQRERARFRVPYGARLLVDEGQQVARAQKLAEWDPYTLPIITERAGKVEYIDLIEGITLVERMDEVTGLTSKVVVDYKQAAKGVDLRPRLQLKDENGEVVRLPNGTDARYFLAPELDPVGGQRREVAAGDVLARIPREGSKTRDITGGLPRVAELFEARRPKDHAVIAEIDGRVEFGKDYKNKRRIIVKNDETTEETEYLIPKGKHVSVQEGDFVRRGDPLVDGPRVPHDILKVLGRRGAVRLPGERDPGRLSAAGREDQRQAHRGDRPPDAAEGGDPRSGRHDVPGRRAGRPHGVRRGERQAWPRTSGRRRRCRCCRASPRQSCRPTASSRAASFQETTRVLTEAATAGKVDNLTGLKENVIVGRLIPAGTGSVMNRLRAIAAGRDQRTLSMGTRRRRSPRR